MASNTRVLPLVLAVAACALLFRGLFAAGHGSEAAFAAPQTVAHAVHRNCQPVRPGALLAGQAQAMPAVVSGVPARQGVAAHFKVTLETPDGKQEFECPEDVYILDQAEEEEPARQE
uniref:Ferredoxin thioredoxin reductase alpha chain domain-containing protein n=1 Tax=Alexandrium monilatum TaxID=311494 RepID=A0A7S4VAF1_9DINO